MKVHLYELANPNNPKEQCSVQDCKNKASHWWDPPLWKPSIALCQFHYDFPTPMFKEFVEEFKLEDARDREYDYADIYNE